MGHQVPPSSYLNVQRQADDWREFRTVGVDPERAPHGGWAFESYATGDWRVGRLVAALEERGVITRPTPSRPPAAPTVVSFHCLLSIPYSKGIVTLNDARKVGSHEPQERAHVRHLPQLASPDRPGRGPAFLPCPRPGEIEPARVRGTAPRQALRRPLGPARFVVDGAAADAARQPRARLRGDLGGA